MPSISIVSGASTATLAASSIHLSSEMDAGKRITVNCFSDEVVISNNKKRQILIFVVSLSYLLFYDKPHVRPVSYLEYRPGIAAVHGDLYESMASFYRQ